MKEKFLKEIGTSPKKKNYKFLLHETSPETIQYQKKSIIQLELKEHFGDFRK
jgi:hypothetical protein